MTRPKTIIRALRKQQLEINLAKLLSCDFSSSSVQQALDAIEEFLGPQLQPCSNLYSSLEVYRARIELSEEEASSSSSFANPSASLAKLGRANLVGTPVFYGSFDPATPCMEVRAKDDEPIWVACYTKQNQIDLFARDFSLPKQNVGLESNTQHAATETLVEQIVEGSLPGFAAASTKEEIIEMIQAVNRIFVMKNYNLSARVAYNWIFSTARKKNTTAILYSSELDNHRLNIAIRPSDVEKNLVLDEVYKCYYHHENRKLTIDQVGRPMRSNQDTIEWYTSLSTAQLVQLEQRFYRSHVVNKTKVPSPVPGSLIIPAENIKLFEEVSKRLASYNLAYDLEVTCKILP